MRSLLRVIAACSAALFIPLLIPLVTNRVFTLDDLGAYNIPMRSVYSEALHRGDSILWTPAVFSGFYLFGESQLGMAHPWHLLLYRFLPLALAFNIEMIGSYAAMFAGFVLLLKRIGLSKESRWFGAMVFTFSGYNLYHLIHVNLIAAVAHLPWLILTAHILATAEDRKTRAKAFVALAVLVASQILVGHLQTLWMSLLAVGSMCLYLLWRNAPVKGTAFVAGAFMAGALAGGVQLLPLLEVVRSSERTAWSPAASLSFSLAPVDLVQLWSPFTFRDRSSIETLSIHEFIVYNGAFCTTALVWVALRWRAMKRSRLTPALLTFAAIGLLLALGKYGGLYTSLLAIPGLHWFRAPSRHLVLYHLSISILAAIAFEDLVDLASRGQRLALRRLWPLAIPGALAMGTAVVTSMLVAGRGYRVAGPSDAAPWVLLFLVVPFLFAATARGSRWALALLVVIAAGDQGYFGYQYVFSDPVQPLQTIEALAARAPIPAEAQRGDLLQTYQGYGLENVPVLRGFRIWPGYVGLTPELTLRSQNRDLVAQRIAGARWRLTRFPTIELIPDTAARARLLSTVKVSSNINVDVRTIDILNEALVEEPIDDLTGPSGSARVVEDRPGRITVETTAPGRQLLALTERFDSGWRVTDDVIQPTIGASEASNHHPVRVYGDFLGYVVDAGVHRVTFRFAPRSFTNGLLLTLFGLVLVVCVVPFAFFGTVTSRKSG